MFSSTWLFSFFSTLVSFTCLSSLERLHILYYDLQNGNRAKAQCVGRYQPILYAVLLSGKRAADAFSMQVSVITGGNAVSAEQLCDLGHLNAATDGGIMEKTQRLRRA